MWDWAAHLRAIRRPSPLAAVDSTHVTTLCKSEGIFAGPAGTRGPVCHGPARECVFVFLHSLSLCSGQGGFASGCACCERERPCHALPSCPSVSPPPLPLLLGSERLLCSALQRRARPALHGHDPPTPARPARLPALPPSPARAACALRRGRRRRRLCNTTWASSSSRCRSSGSRPRATRSCSTPQTCALRSRAAPLMARLSGRVLAFRDLPSGPRG